MMNQEQRRRGIDKWDWVAFWTLLLIVLLIAAQEPLRTRYLELWHSDNLIIFLVKTIAYHAALFAVALVANRSIRHLLKK